MSQGKELAGIELTGMVQAQKNAVFYMVVGRIDKSSQWWGLSGELKETANEALAQVASVYDDYDLRVVKVGLPLPLSE